jgi:hypothetical protein
MTDDECVHGMTAAWCGICNGAEASSPVSRSRSGESGFHGGQSKQDLLDQLCQLLAVPRESVGRGSSLPSHVFDLAARRAGVRPGSMPEVGERIARKAGLTWGPDCDSRGTPSAGGSTVTREGLSVMNKALGMLLR